MALYTPSVGVVVAAAAIAAIAARAAWQATRAAAVLDRALTHVTTAAGLERLPIPPETPRTRRLAPDHAEGMR